MDRDSLADLPADSRREVVAEVCAVLDVEAATAEDLVSSVRGALVGRDGASRRARRLLGRGEFCQIFPRVLAFFG
jgi:hypothetical protein